MGMRTGQVKMLQSSPFLLEFSHLFLTCNSWVAESLSLISRRKKVTFDSFSSFHCFYGGERIQSSVLHHSRMSLSQAAFLNAGLLEHSLSSLLPTSCTCSSAAAMGLSNCNRGLPALKLRTFMLCGPLWKLLPTSGLM